MVSHTTLERRLGLPTLTLYGVGVIVGAGIYVLVGDLAAMAGNAAWLAFVAAAVAALPTGLSYAELASRYPRSAGEAVFADRAFERGELSFLVGFLVLASGIASTAAMSHAFAGYFGDLVEFPAGWRWAVMVGFLTLLSGLNHRGIEEAAWVNAVCTTATVSALLLLVVVGLPHWGAVDLLDATPASERGASGAAAIVGAGCALAFFAFIGFEDICNVAEEVREPSQTIPRALLLSLGISTALFCAVGITIVSVVPLDELVASEVPIALLWQHLLPFPTEWLDLVAIFAVTTTALFNLIMASRILYGMGKNGWVPQAFAWLHPKRKTPTWGIVAALVLAVSFALTGFLQVLAEATNVIILLAFFSVNLSLLVVKRREVPPDDPAQPHFRVPLLVPAAGLVMTAYLFTQYSLGAYVRAGGLLAVGAILYSLQAVTRRS